MNHQRIANLTLDERSIVRWNADIDHERKVAIFDLLEDNKFAPQAPSDGPFHVHLRLEESRLVLDVSTQSGGPVDIISVPLVVFRRIIRDYFTVCDSYFNAIKTASPSRIEAIDMGRRALHDEGSDLLRERLASKVEIDAKTARRLFTLLCVVTLRG
ncbi:MAG: UPF0262 family protein [Sphingomonadales bacterium]